MRKLIKLVFVSLLFYTIPVEMADAGTTGKITGQVTDQNDKNPLAGVNVYLKDYPYGASTDSDGYFSIINIPPGTYELVFDMVGYSTVTVKNVKVYSDRTTRQNAKLAEQVLEGEAVIVEATRPPIEADRTSTMSIVDDKAINDMPVQELSTVIRLQAGVVTGSGGDIHFRGGRSREVAYLIDGVPVSNAFSQSGGSNVNVENSFVKELQVISGTFNAEYGSAQSAVINVVTKGASQEFHGQVQVFAGDNLSNKTDRFIGIDRFNLLAEKNIQATLSGPLFFKNLGFFISARYHTAEGYLHGERRYNPIDGWKINAYRRWFNEKNTTEASNMGRIPIPDSLVTGDNSIVIMTPSEMFDMTGKLIYQAMPTLRFTYSLFTSSSNGQGYSDSWRYAPDGRNYGYGNSMHHFFYAQYSPTQNTFANLRFSYQHNYSEGYLYKDVNIADYPGDSGYQPLGASDSQTGFVQGDNQWGRGNTTRDLYLANGDFNWQINKYNFVKIGFNAKQHNIHYYNRPLVATEEWRNYAYTTNINGKNYDFNEYWNAMTDYWKNWDDIYGTTKLREAKTTDGSYINYTRKPIEAALYVQDKLEMGKVIINAGLRFDYFDPQAKTIVNERNLSDIVGDPDNLKDASVKMQLSPRIGLSFPISATGAFHVSYGHFFQMPSFSLLYRNPIDENMTSLLLQGRTIGDPDLEPENTVAYEIGLQQQLSTYIVGDLTMYYKDIRNLLGLEAIRTVDAVGYYRYMNRDYGNVKGITLSLRTLQTGLFSGTIDYTLQYANGSASDPNYIQLIQVSTRMSDEPVQFVERQVLPLDWDQRHTVNLTLNMSRPDNWLVSLIGRVGSGLPYSPSSVEELQLPTTEFKNSARKPTRYTLDLMGRKHFKIGKADMSVFLRVYNLFDHLNENYVYSTTGRATQNARRPEDLAIQQRMLKQGGRFTLQEWDNNPNWFSEPRRIQIGLIVRY